MSEIFGYLIVEKDVDISTLPYENEEYTLLPGSIAYVVGGGAYMLTPSNRWQFLDPEIQKIVLPVFKNVSSSGGGGGGSSGLVVNVTEDEETHDLVCDKTWQEMWDAAASGSCIIVHIPDSEEWGFYESYQPWMRIDENGYFLIVLIDGDVYGFGTETQDGYPRRELENPGNDDNPPDLH